MTYSHPTFVINRFSMLFLTAAALLLVPQSINAQTFPAGPKIDPAKIQTAKVISSLDGIEQPLRYFIPEGARQPMPLLVLLHSWSGDVNQNTVLPLAAAECERLGWAVVHPNFRGPNFQPTACASDLAVQDVVDAVRWMEKQTKIDPQRRYVAGASGGGHMTLVMSGRHPELWAAASAWVPISDLAAWHRETATRLPHYAKNIVDSCGGLPGSSPEVDAQYELRSPLTHLAKSKGLPVDINAGLYDGHTPAMKGGPGGSVPVSHSLLAFNLLADVYEQPDVKFTPQEVVLMTTQTVVPDRDRAAAPQEPDRMHPVLVRRVAGPARVTIFDGGHEGDIIAAMKWLATHHRPDAAK